MGLDGFELIVATEKEFSIEITDAEAETLLTVGDLHQLVMTKTNAELKGLDPTDAFNRISVILQDFFCVPEAAITMEARFIRDLGLD